MNTLGCLTLVLAMAAQVYGTAQIPEVIRYNGKEYLLFSTPLESFLDGMPKRPWFKTSFGLSRGNGSAEERGYFATWQIEDSKLYLSKIDAWLCWRVSLHRLSSPCRRFEVEDILGRPDAKQKHFARWFTGTLRIPLEKVLRYVHNGFHSVYEHDMLIEVTNGLVAEPTIVDNRNAPLPYGLDGDASAWNNLKGQPIKPLFEGSRLKTRETILPGVGLGELILGASREQIESVMGKGENVETPFHLAETTVVEHRPSRVLAVYGRDSKVLEAIYFHASPRSEESVSTFKTDKGISWNTIVAEVRKAYGEPGAENSGTYDALKTVQWKVLEYPGIEFRFENERLVRIGVLPILYAK